MLKICSVYYLCRDSDLLQRDWSALNDDDLQLFGFENELLRREMLTKFANTPNQALTYEMFVRSIFANDVVLLLLLLFLYNSVYENENDCFVFQVCGKNGR